MNEMIIVEQLEKLNATVGEIRDISWKILGGMPKPENLPKYVLDIATAIVGTLGILGIIDQIIKWIRR
jgi:hypothetical protein